MPKKLSIGETLPLIAPYSSVLEARRLTLAAALLLPPLFELVLELERFGARAARGGHRAAVQPA
jgi:hypothetical protein